MNGTGVSRIAHYNGATWTTIDDAVPGVLTCIEPSERGEVYIGGWHGLLLYGHQKQGFVRVAKSLPFTDIVSLREFDEVLYIASYGGFFYFDYRQNRSDYVRPAVNPPMLPISHLDSIDGTLWVIGKKTSLFYDGIVWTRLNDPDNPR